MSLFITFCRSNGTTACVKRCPWPVWSFHYIWLRSPQPSLSNAWTTAKAQTFCFDIGKMKRISFTHTQVVVLGLLVQMENIGHFLPADWKINTHTNMVRETSVQTTIPFDPRSSVRRNQFVGNFCSQKIKYLVVDSIEQSSWSEHWILHSMNVTRQKAHNRMSLDFCDHRPFPDLVYRVMVRSQKVQTNTRKSAVNKTFTGCCSLWTDPAPENAKVKQCISQN